MIELESVAKTYDQGRTWAVRRVDLSVERGALLVLLGESGSGKTTTLKMINRLVEPSAGRIRVAGEDVLAVDPVGLRRRIGYVFQGIGLFPHLTIAENIQTVPQLLGWPSPDCERRVAELLDMMGLPGDFGRRYPHELSGGQRQRVGVARALAARPGVLLMDEPFGAVDPITRAELREQLKALQRRLELTIVLVTHDVTEALLLADHIAVMRAGRILGAGTQEALLRDPPAEYVEALMRLPRQQADEVERLAGRGA